MEKGINFFLERYRRLGGIVKPIEPKQSIRVNTLAVSEEKIVRRLAELGVSLSKVPYTKFGYFIEKSKFSVGAIAESLLGYYFLQGSASQIPVEILDPGPDELVLDCCASPGGKTTQLSQFMENKGTVIALEKQKHRLPSLLNNLERLHCHNTIVFHMDALKAERLNLEFDKILLDAPCSGNFASEPNWFEMHRNFNTVSNRAALQRDLLSAVLKVLKKDGILVYSTCSLEPEEDELNMQWLLDSHNVKLEKVDSIGDPGITNVFGKKLNPQIANSRRLWPHKTNTEGFFIAKVRKL